MLVADTPLDPKAQEIFEGRRSWLAPQMDQALRMRPAGAFVIQDPATVDLPADAILADLSTLEDAILTVRAHGVHALSAAREISASVPAVRLVVIHRDSLTITSVHEARAERGRAG